MWTAQTGIGKLKKLAILNNCSNLVGIGNDGNFIRYKRVMGG